ncbi:MAG TPA: HAD family hydrolase [Oligoflexia bacterium]|nr:HAD family hydrolase [Oligoflexia bacterium]HMP26579.1 HAD family hydrolase [Oligoflexia bacterium]
MTANRFKTAIFDLDGTLTDSFPAISESYKLAFLENGLPKPPTDLLRNLNGIPLSEQTPIILQTLDLDIKLAPQIVKTYIKIYPEISTKLTQAYDQIHQTLHELKSLSITLAIVTGKRRAGAMLDLQIAGLNGFFQTIVVLEDVKQPKPNAEPINLAIERLTSNTNKAINQNEVIMIGDADLDILAAKAAGISSCAALWGTTNQKKLLQANPTYKATTPLELLKII